MKSSIILLSTVICSAILFGCKKDSSENTGPQVFSGDDQTISLPENSVILQGSAFDMQNNIEKTIWKKLTGPSVYSFEDSTSLTTAVTSLRPGKYMFQLTAIDKLGLADNDTTFITVIEPGAAGTYELVFEDIAWNCPMGCSATVNNIYGYTQGGIIKEVFIRTKDSDPWEPVERWGDGLKEYSYYIENNSLGIYTEEASGTVDIRVIY